MWWLILLSVIQCMALSVGQVTLKIALERMPSFGWTSRFWVEGVFLNWWLLASGLLFGGGSLLWMYILRHYPLSIAYPLSSLSFVIATVLAVVVFQEAIPFTRWIGVFMIMAGCALVAVK